MLFFRILSMVVAICALGGGCVLLASWLQDRFNFTVALIGFILYVSVVMTLVVTFTDNETECTVTTTPTPSTVVPLPNGYSVQSGSSTTTVCK